MATKTNTPKMAKTATKLIKRVKRDIARSNFSESVDDTALYVSDLINRHTINGCIGLIGINYM